MCGALAATHSDARHRRHEIPRRTRRQTLHRDRQRQLRHALAEAVNGLYKSELIRQREPWRTVEQVELATFEYVWWWNNQRLHSELDYRTPAEVEALYSRQHPKPTDRR